MDALQNGVLATTYVYTSAVLLTGILLGAVVAAFLHGFVSAKPKSYVILNFDHQSRFDKLEKSERRSIILSVLLAIGAFVVGIVGNLMATGIWEWSESASLF